jgi:excisionase family DNA binding protein
MSDKAADRYFNTMEVADYLRRTRGAIGNLVLRRKIPHRKVGGRLLFDREEIDRWVKMSEGLNLEEIEQGERR